MSNISVKVNLGKLKCVVKPLTGKSGLVQDCLIIPISVNNLVRGKEGIYLDLIAFRLKEMKPDSKDTHCIRQSFSKDYLESLTEMQKSSLPFLGSLVDWDKTSSINVFNDLVAPVVPDGLAGDLPF